MKKGLLTILLVEDHSGFRRCTRDYLQFVMSAEIIEAADGIRAMEILKHQRPDVTIVDYNLPGMSGLDVTKALHLLNAGMKVIMMTGHHEPEIVRAAFNAGVSGFVTKQDSSIDLVDCIEAVFNGQMFVSRSVKYEQTVCRPEESTFHTAH